MRVNAVKILLCAAVLSPLLALWPSLQDPAATDWKKEVDRACTSPRYGLRLAAARKVAKAGDAAVAAIREFAGKNGANAVPAALVDALADDAPATAGVLELLVAWAQDRDFYWRASAMRGLALRAQKVAAFGALAPKTLFASYHDDPAWLMRTHARLGTSLLGDDSAMTLPEADPRARARLPMLLLQQGKLPPLQPLFDALADERTFQADPWGQRMAAETHKVLKAWLGDAHPLHAGGSFADVATGLQALLEPLRRKSGQDLKLPVLRTDPPTTFTGGIEVLSCKHGDQFVQWSDDGQVFLGIDAAARVAISAATWERLTKERTALALAESMGVIVCDSMRLRWQDPPTHSKCAPGSLPGPAANWLKALAAALEEAGEPGPAAALRAGLDQFAAR